MFRLKRRSSGVLMVSHQP